MINKLWMICICYLGFCSCHNMQRNIVYKINDNYNGPGAIFIYNSIRTSSDTIMINDGLGRISKGKNDRSFVFQSNENNNEIEIVPIGKKLQNVADSVRYVFELTNTTLSSSCTPNDDIEVITFFIGTPSQYTFWKKLKQSALNSFNSKGVAWCKYYKDGFYQE